jgi:RNA polymerase sigma factor (sigma-70 family)
MDSALTDARTRDLDVAELYRSLADRLTTIVKLDTQASDLVVEDACQFAWDRLIGQASELRRDCALSWLATTAVREANRLARRDDRELPLPDGHTAVTSDEGRHAAAPTCDEVIERRERLTLIRRLPERQQRLLWLQALGLSYDEMALYTGCTRRTVERQLLRARQRIRRLAADPAV